VSPRDDGPSKTRLKREAEALQSLGEALAEMPREALEPLELPERLLHALEELGRITSHEARRRQRQFIGRLMRDVDPAPLQALVEARARPSREAARLFRITERWRDRLVAEGAAAVPAFMIAYPAADAGELAEAVEAARAGRSGAPKRLFRMIKALVDSGAANDGTPLLE
jgi:ribosome-associated protein